MAFQLTSLQICVCAAGCGVAVIGGGGLIHKALSNLDDSAHQFNSDGLDKYDYMDSSWVDSEDPDSTNHAIPTIEASQAKAYEQSVQSLEKQKTQWEGITRDEKIHEMETQRLTLLSHELSVLESVASSEEQKINILEKKWRISEAEKNIVHNRLMSLQRTMNFIKADEQCSDENESLRTVIKERELSHSAHETKSGNNFLTYAEPALIDVNKRIAGYTVTDPKTDQHKADDIKQRSLTSDIQISKDIIAAQKSWLENPTSTTRSGCNEQNKWFSTYQHLRSR